MAGNDQEIVFAEQASENAIALYFVKDMVIVKDTVRNRLHCSMHG